mgnify:CR=1 FL=1
MIILNDLVDEVERLLRDGYEFNDARREVLKRHGITLNRNYYFSKLGRMYKTRGRKRKADVAKTIRNKQPAVRQRSVNNTDASFTGLSLEETRQKLANSDF